MLNQLLNKLDKREQEFVKQFFAKAPEEFLSSVMLKSYPENYRLITAGDACSHVYILLRGRLRAIEEHISDEPYQFTEITAIDIVGDYEHFLQDACRLITLTTMEPCRFLIIPARDYMHWIKNDNQALFLRTQLLIRQSVRQGQNERRIHFLNNKTKLLHLLYNQESFPHSTDAFYQIPCTRQELANKLGCSVRTVNRLVEALRKEQLINIVHGKIQITADQHRQIRRVLAIS